MQNQIVALLAASALVVCACAYPTITQPYDGNSLHGNSLHGNSLQGNSLQGNSLHDNSIDYHAPAHYSFNYAVNDPDTHDIKNHWESRDGDVVKGSYSLLEADGTTRTVDYTADKHSGFNAVVRKSGHAHHPPTHKTKHY